MRVLPVRPGRPATPGPWESALDGCDAVVNLAGHNLFADALERRGQAADPRQPRLRHRERRRRDRPQAGTARRVLVQASAIGYYGPHGDEELTEDSPSGSDFMAVVCREWEEAAHRRRGARRPRRPDPHRGRAGAGRGGPRRDDADLQVAALGQRRSATAAACSARARPAVDELDPPGRHRRASSCWPSTTPRPGPDQRHRPAPGPQRRFSRALKALAAYAPCRFLPFGPPDAVLEVMLGEVAQVDHDGSAGPAGRPMAWATLPVSRARRRPPRTFRQPPAAAPSHLAGRPVASHH